MTNQDRLYFLDNLKVFLIILVILHHVGQAYGSTGGTWFYSYPGERVQIMGLFFWFNASFFMGLFFFISGYLFPPSFDHHGARKFLINKLVRFGIPLLFGPLIMLPLLVYIQYNHYVSSIDFKEFYSNIWFQSPGGTAAPQYKINLAHLWFIEHLLIYSILYVSTRWLLTRVSPSLANPGKRVIRIDTTIAYVLLLGLTTNIIRTAGGFPMDKWIGFLGFMQMEPAHMPQYLSLFIIGVLACRWSFLDSITRPGYIYWLIPGVGIYLMVIILLFTVGPKKAFGYAEFSEALICVGVCIGLLALFRKYFNSTGKIMKILSDNVYEMYIFHIPVVVALQYAFAPVIVDALSLFVIVSLLSVPGTFLVSYLLRLIPGLKRII
ncbi:MAG: acyltransferase [Desulfatiglans sp.]|nr:acyltransferase [Desulfatiglans sp.]